MAKKRQTTRRQFLVGHSATEALADLVVGQAPDECQRESAPKPAAARQSPGGYLLHVGRSAMACDWQVLLNAGQYPLATEIALEALDLVDVLEEQLSVYRPSSEISCLNRQAAEQPVPVERRLYELLRHARQLAIETEGAFDITATPLWKLWGFHRRAGRFPTPDEIEHALRCSGYRDLHLDDRRCTVHFAKRGMELNLGAIGKGYALDRCAELLEAAGIADFMMHGGQSSVLVRGSRGISTEDDQGWTVGLSHPLRQQQRLGALRLRGAMALGTSGSGKQYFHHEGRRYGHILDPRSGYPAEGVLSATVLAPTATDADALSTALLVMGPDAAVQFCDQRTDIGALLICPGSRSGSIAVSTYGLAKQAWQGLD